MRWLFRLFFTGAEEIAVQVVFSWMAVYVFRLDED
jgi:hypothetical protein